MVHKSSLWGPDGVPEGRNEWKYEAVPNIEPTGFSNFYTAPHSASSNSSKLSP